VNVSCVRLESNRYIQYRILTSEAQYAVLVRLGLNVMLGKSTGHCVLGIPFVHRLISVNQTKLRTRNKTAAKERVSGQRYSKFGGAVFSSFMPLMYSVSLS
jgi:hypothetical protein